LETDGGTALDADEPGAEVPATGDERWSAPARYILYYDLTHLKMAGFNLSVIAARDWLESNPLRRQDEVMVVAGGQTLRILHPLSPLGDSYEPIVDAVRNGYQGLESWAVMEGDELVGGRVREILGLPTFWSRRALADSYATVDAMHTRRSLRNLEHLMALFDTVEGTKHLIFFQETIRQHPGRQYPFVSTTTDVTPFLQDLATAANERNVRIYPVHAEGLVAGRRSGKDDALQMLASETGGQYVFNTNRLTDVIDRAATDASCFYRVGFRVRPEFSGRTQRITVEITAAGNYRVRHRRTLHDPTREERDRDRIRAALLDPPSSRAIPVAASAYDLYEAIAGARVRLEIHVSLEDLLDLPAGETGTESRQVRLQVGGTVVPQISPDEREDALGSTTWSYADLKRESWSFARQSVLQLPADRSERTTTHLLASQEVHAPPGDYRLVAVVLDELAQVVGTGIVDFSIESQTSGLSKLRLASASPETIALHEERQPEAREKRKKRSVTPLPPALPDGVRVVESMAPEADGFLVYSMCDPVAASGKKESSDGPRFGGWQIERFLQCAGDPEPVVLTATPMRSLAEGEDCIVLMELLPAPLPAGPCRATMQLTRPGSKPEARELAFSVRPPTGSTEQARNGADPD
jgi:hypothetical protein